ncbi:MAG: metallophosphoesterase [Polyangiaceae bacterium]
MTIIAHISDLHLLEDAVHERRGTSWWRLQYLTFGKPQSPATRRLRVRRLLDRALRSHADHLVITGDLTEDGTLGQFESLAQVLHESGWLPSRVTLVPGNHDVYSHPGAWREALRGPLAPYAPTSEEGAIVALPDACIVPLSTAFHQPVMRSAGALSKAALSALDQWAALRSHEWQAVVLAQHHPPRRYALSPLQWLDGLEGYPELSRILGRHDHLHVLHGHTHETRSRPVRRGGPDRVFSVDSAQSSPDALRLYRARYRRLWPEPVRLETMQPASLASLA